MSDTCWWLGKGMGVGEVVEEWSVGGCGVGSREGVGFGGDVVFCTVV